MTIKKWLSILLMLSISILVFTACESDDEPDPDDPTTTITPKAVTEIYAGQTDSNALTIQWKKTTEESETWFKGYQLKITGGTTNQTIEEGFYNGDGVIQYTFAGATKGVEYTFSVVVVANEGEKSPEKTIKWATATHFTKNDNGDVIRIYLKESANYGSGLELYGPDNAPRTRKIANGADWNIAVGSKDKLFIGTASSVATAVSYNLTGTPKDAYITSPLTDVDTDVLNQLVMPQDLSNYTFEKKYIDLNASENNRTKGLVFFARIGEGANAHYAKIVVKKIGGKYIQSETSTDPYIEVLVSYQTVGGMPYAKTSGN